MPAVLELPPLPDIFGNYTIKGIAEVVSPPAVGWWPDAPAWRVLALVLLVMAARWCWRRYHHWQRNRYRGIALGALAGIAADTVNSQANLARISRLLKSTALQSAPRVEIAALSGSAWRDWLQASTAQPVFSDANLELLVNGLYRPAEAGADLSGLLRESGQWIREHRGPGDD